jgi:hypothetical protein
LELSPFLYWSYLPFYGRSLQNKKGRKLKYKKGGKSNIKKGDNSNIKREVTPI